MRRVSLYAPYRDRGRLANSHFSRASLLTHKKHRPTAVFLHLTLSVYHLLHGPRRRQIHSTIVQRAVICMSSFKIMRSVQFVWNVAVFQDDVLLTLFFSILATMSCIRRRDAESYRQLIFDALAAARSSKTVLLCPPHTCRGSSGPPTHSSHTATERNHRSASRRQTQREPRAPIRPKYFAQSCSVRSARFVAERPAGSANLPSASGAALAQTPWTC